MRVAITGFGVVCAVGKSTSEAWEKIARGERGVGPVTLFDVKEQRAQIAAEVKGVEVPREGGVVWSRSDAMALAAAREAMTEAKLDPKSARVGLIVGGTTGGMFETEAILARMHADPSARVPTPEFLSHPLSATGDRLHATLGPFSRVRAVCSACSSGANAFVLGKAWIELGLCDAVVVGGTDGLCRLTFTGFNALGAIDPNPSRPFDARRRGLTIGEGAGFAVLERADHAKARGVEHKVELVGIGLTSEAHHITNPAEDGVQAARAIVAAIKHAQLTPADVDYVNAHGTGTPLNDVMESRAISRALEGDASRAYVSSTKAVMGHTLGAAGALEAIVAALAVRDGRVPPTAGLEEIDPACAPLRHVPAGGVEHDVRVALSSSFGFGGVDTVIAVARAGYAPEREPQKRVVWLTGIGSASKIGAPQWDENDRLVDPSVTVAAEDPTSSLDAGKARRLDRTARLATVAAQMAWTSGDDGIFLGTSYGDTDASAAFMARTFEKGPRLAPPAEFPNLVPSSPSGHASIYLKTHGPAISIPDLSTSGEAAIATAFELIAAAFIEAATAGSAEGPSDIVAKGIAPIFRDASAPVETDRTEGAAVVRLMREPSAEVREQLADTIEVRQVVQGRDVPEVLAQIEPPYGKAAIVVPRIDAALKAAIAKTEWKNAKLYEIAPAIGRHEGLGGFAVAAASSLVVKRVVTAAMAIGTAPGRAFAIFVDRVD